MTLGEYLTGVALLAAVVGSVAVGAWCLRARFLPGWRGAPARLAEAVLGSSVVLVVSQLLGLVGQFGRAAFVAGCSSAGLLIAVAVRRGGRPLSRAVSRHAVPAPPTKTVTGLSVASVPIVAAEWGTRIAASVDRGMYSVDDLRYHMPLAARFVQERWLTRLHFTNLDLLPTFQPANAEVFHAAGMLVFGRDVLSPLINIGWLGLTLLAGWCIGRSRGLAPVSLAATALVLGLPVMSVTQAGSAGNDLVSIAFFLSAVALLINAEGRSAASIIAALAAGMALGTKPYMIIPVAGLWAGAVAMAPRRARRMTALTWAIALLATGGFWYVRNLVHVGNPVPAVDLFGLHSPYDPVFEATGFSVAHYLTDANFWRHVVPRGLALSFGPVWPLILVVSMTGLVAAAFGRSHVDRRYALIGIAAAIAYVFTPYGAGGLDGDPWLFAADLRFLTPAVAIGLIFGALHLAARIREDRRSAVPAVLLAATIASQFSGSGFWSAWLPGYRKEGLAIGVAAAALAIVGVAARRSSARRTLMAMGVAAGIAAAIGSGWTFQRVYLRDRYVADVQTGVRADAVHAWAQTVSNARIGIVKLEFQYPLYGPDGSNRVEYVGREGSRGDLSPIVTCREWRRAIADGRFRFVVVSTHPLLTPAGSPEVEWTLESGGGREVVRQGDVSVIAVKSPIDPDGCGD